MDIENKIFSALERFHIAHKSALQGAVADIGISPLQANILMYLNEKECAASSFLAERLCVSKPTISDAIAALVQKKLIKKVSIKGDSRSYEIFLTAKGKTGVSKILQYETPFIESLRRLEINQKNLFWYTMLELISGLEERGFVPHQKMCLTCAHFEKDQSGAQFFCKLLQSPLAIESLRLDCGEHIVPSKQ